MSRTLHFRLSFMMFLQYSAPACTAPILSYYLKDYLHFSAMQVGQVLAVMAVGAILAPFLATYVADRYVSARVLLSLCHAAAGCVMLALVRQDRFVGFLWLYFVYGVVFLPTHGLSNTVALHHVTDVKRDFGGIRMWGTAGWVFIAWTFGLFWLRGGKDGAVDPRLPHALVLCACVSFAQAIYALSLPRAEKKVSPPASFVPWDAFKVFVRPSIIVLCVATLFTSMIHQSFYYGMGPFMKQTGVADNHIMPLISIGQFSEVIVLALLGRSLARFGVRRVILIGVLAQVFRFVVFAIGYPFPLIVAALASHGLCYAFFFTAGYIYIDEHSPKEARAGAQQLYTILIMGVGYFMGHMVSGKLGQLFTIAGSTAINFNRFWLMPALAAMAVAAALLLFFHEEAPEVEKSG